MTATHHVQPDATPLERAIEIAGSAQALARELHVTRAAVWQWGLSGRRVPAEHCPRIERLTFGRVRCEQLRPDVDWGYLRGTVQLDRGGELSRVTGRDRAREAA